MQVALFSLLKHKEHFNSASQLLEEILPERAYVLDLSLVPDFNQLVASLDLNKLAVFCRVLALIVFDSGEVSD
jgi:Trpc4-associated protein